LIPLCIAGAIAGVWIGVIFAVVYVDHCHDRPQTSQEARQ
jgi:hypothetical protein